MGDRESRWTDNEDKQSCHSSLRYSTLTYLIILLNNIKMFLTDAELCSGNENENTDPGS